jgi:hypothetical protein
MKITYTIDKRGSEDRILVNAWDGEIEIAEFMCEKIAYCEICTPPCCICFPRSEIYKLWIRRKGIFVKEEYRDKKVKPRISHTIYRLAEHYFRQRIMPDGKATQAGKRFREGYEKIYESWENPFEEMESDILLPAVEHIPMRKIR